MDKAKKSWRIEYAHNDGRCGTVEAVTEVGASKAFDYGNGKHGVLIVDGYAQSYDLRYCQERDLHMAMLKDYFGRGLVKATPI